MKKVAIVCFSLCFMFLMTKDASACASSLGTSLSKLSYACRVAKDCGSAVSALRKACVEVTNLDRIMAKLEATGSIAGETGSRTVTTVRDAGWGYTIVDVRQSFSQAIAEKFMNISVIADRMNAAVDAGFVPGSASEQSVMSGLSAYVAQLNAESAAIMSVVRKYSAINYSDIGSRTKTCHSWGCERPER